MKILYFYKQVCSYSYFNWFSSGFSEWETIDFFWAFTPIAIFNE